MSLAINNLDEAAPTFHSGRDGDGDRREQRRGPGGLHRDGDRSGDDGPSNPVTYSPGGGTDAAASASTAAAAQVTLTANPDYETKSRRR